MIVVIGVAAAAAGGTVVRVALREWADGDRPWGTLIANVVGSFALGLLVGADPSRDVVTVIGTGGLGALTTWSSVAVAADRDMATFFAIALPLMTAALGVAIGTTLA